ncbi:hypothetical protein KY308_02925 [Candidatus Woesearchaeota archaeon]|nr:hypothetical protein [Candidatus Woesearchaeota archaeon]
MKRDIIEKLAALATAAFAFVAALAWNDAILAIFEAYFPDRANIMSKFLYAIIVTMIGVYVTVIMGKAKSKINHEKKR